MREIKDKRPAPKIELLSPAGSPEAMHAAFQAGADAVYLGSTAFGARRFAANFDDSQLQDAMLYAHERGKKIYVTVNTLVKDREMDDLRRLLSFLQEIGTDAVLLQDLGVARIVQREFPGLKRHASTQMTICNRQGAQFLLQEGFTRAVPARECTLEELHEMSATGLEIEAFGHGALCVCVSGQCLFSSMVGGRSGNRGCCAQPCRLPYSLEDGTKGYLLSPKDLMLIEHIPEIMDAGVCSLKLEGRMKRPDYVYTVTRCYREAMDAAEEHRPFRLNDEMRREIEQAFHRGGFTEGYILGKNNAALMSWERPGNAGVPVGRVKSVGRDEIIFTADCVLHGQDLLALRREGQDDVEFRFSGKGDLAEGDTFRIRRPGGVSRVGDALVRLIDQSQVSREETALQKEVPCVPVSALLRMIPGERPVLTLCDRDGNSVSVEGECSTEIAHSAVDSVRLKEQIGKMGGTPYLLERFSLEGENGFLPVSQLNRLRRDALAQLREARTNVKKVEPITPWQPAPLENRRPMLYAVTGIPEEIGMLLEAGADSVILHPRDYRADALKQMLEACSHRIILDLPAFATGKETQEILELVKDQQTKISGVRLNNPGQLSLPWPVPCISGPDIPVMNGYTAAYLAEHGVQLIHVSTECNARELKALFAGGGCFAVEAYGRRRLMLLSHCPRETEKGKQSMNPACRGCDASGGWPAVYTDRKGVSFPAMRVKHIDGCHIEILNSTVTDMAKRPEVLRQFQCSLVLVMTDETIEEQCTIVHSYRQLMDGLPISRIPRAEATTGMLFREVE